MVGLHHQRKIAPRNHPDQIWMQCRFRLITRPDFRQKSWLKEPVFLSKECFVALAFGLRKSRHNPVPPPPRQVHPAHRGIVYATFLHRQYRRKRSPVAWYYARYSGSRRLMRMHEIFMIPRYFAVPHPAYIHPPDCCVDNSIVCQMCACFVQRLDIGQEVWSTVTEVSHRVYRRFWYESR